MAAAAGEAALHVPRPVRALPRALHRRVEAARIPVERITARLALIAGGDDEVWPSTWFVDQIVSTRREHDLDTAVVSVDAAGHSPVFPGTRPAPPSPHLRRGGTPDADRELGERAWPVILATLGLPPAP